MGNFQKFIPGEVDRESQIKRRLNETEELIFKPHQQGVDSLNEEEIEKYININIEELKKTKTNNKIIMLCRITQEVLKDNKERLLKEIKKREEKENDGR